MKTSKLGRISLIVTYSILSISFIHVSAQTGEGYSYLEFVENKGQWDSSVRFRADLAAGNLFMQRTGFTVLLRDTADLRRIGRLLHGDADVLAQIGNTMPKMASGGIAGSVKGVTAAGEGRAEGGAGGGP